MTVIEKIETKLSKYPFLRYTKEKKMITVEVNSSEGFSVWLMEEDFNYTVGFDGWHEEFQDEEKALNAFVFGFSGDCRLKVAQRGNTDCAWTLEAKDEAGQWTEYSTTKLLFTPFWRKHRVVYRTNHIDGEHII